MNINKKFSKKHIKTALAGTMALALLGTSVSGFNAFVKADTPDVVKSGDYSSISRDTTISLDSNGDLNIERTKKDVKPMGKENSWTIFVYLTGSDLESEFQNATRDIKEMFAANYGSQDLDKLNIIIQTGGSTYWHMNEIYSDQVQRFQVKGNKLELIESHPLYSMGDGSTLYSFLNWGVKNYPAEHMGFIFWNHGSGVSQGLCVDTVHDYDSLSLGEVEYAFAKVNKKMTDKFELIGFDTCLSGSIEYANVLAPYTKYMVASADSEPGDGWNYTPIVDYIVKNPDATGKDVGTVIADSYTDFYSNEEDIAGYTTMAVYDLSKIDAACIETNKFAKHLFEKFEQDKSAYNQFAKVIEDSHIYEDLNVDMGTLVKSLNANPELSFNTSNLAKALDELIIYNNIGREFASLGCNGLTLFIPNGCATLSELNMYRNAGFSPYWLDCLEYIAARAVDDSLSVYTANGWSTSPFFHEDNFNFINFDDTTLYTEEAIDLINKNPDYKADGFANNWEPIYETTQQEFPTFTNIPNLPFGDVSLEISRNNISAKLATTNNVKNVFSTVFSTIDDKTVCLGENANVTFDKKTGEISSTFTGEWFTLPDGQLLTTYVLSQSDNKVVYGIPVVVNDIESTIRIEEITSSDGTKDYNLLGLWDATANSLYAARGYLPLNVGTKITPIYDVFNDEKQSYESELGDEYTITSDFDFLFTQVDDGNYSYAYTIDRVFGNDVCTELSTFNVVDGQICE